jgi:transposase-like protein
MRWYVAYPLSLRHLEEMMGERGFSVDKGEKRYLYRAVDKDGNTIDFLLRAHRDRTAARRYFEKSIAGNGASGTVTIDKGGANLAALEAINRRS